MEEAPNRGLIQRPPSGDVASWRDGSLGSARLRQKAHPEE
ncbi:hypothetical protein FM105_01855 [Brevibacterium yomogidense]|uniref:Uncharacterized protein n=1 Tax=Brevibacterium yomogidense TaxID=946573 RepID=A0A1X6WWX6_9MICO|nr:hypothetical protein FM105_01855 [Brevibacterium yomogidense]